MLVTAAVLYGVAGALALRIPRDLLGPDLDSRCRRCARRCGTWPRGWSTGCATSGRAHRGVRPGAIGAHRFFYGISTVSLILLYRNYFHTASESDQALAELSVAVLVSGIGFVTAAVLTPVVTERVTARVWIIALLVGAAVSQVFPGAFFTRPALLVTAFFLGLASQGIKICVDTMVQTRMHDAFRGRVFSLYDVLFNVAFVSAAAVAAVVLPPTGKSYQVLGVVALGYLLTAAVYARVSREDAVAFSEPG